MEIYKFRIAAKHLSRFWLAENYTTAVSADTVLLNSLPKISLSDYRANVTKISLFFYVHREQWRFSWNRKKWVDDTYEPSIVVR